MDVAVDVEKIKKRQERFGNISSVAVDDKKAARAARFSQKVWTLIYSLINDDYQLTVIIYDSSTFSGILIVEIPFRKNTILLPKIEQ